LFTVNGDKEKKIKICVEMMFKITSEKQNRSYVMAW